MSAAIDISPTVVRKEIIAAMVEVLRAGTTTEKIEAARVLLNLKAILAEK
jgi:hypothetical protein